MLKENREIILNDSFDTKGFIIKMDNNLALIKTNEYIVATGIRENNNGKIEWDSGNYFNDIAEAIYYFDSKSLDERKLIEKYKLLFKDISEFIRFGIIVELETNNEKNFVDEDDYKKLKIIYDSYTSNDEMYLLSEEISDLEEDYRYDSIKEMILDYLIDNDIDTSLVSDDEITEMCEAVIEESIFLNESPSTVIFVNDFLENKTEELKSREEKSINNDEAL